MNVTGLVLGVVFVLTGVSGLAVSRVANGGSLRDLLPRRGPRDDDWSGRPSSGGGSAFSYAVGSSADLRPRLFALIKLIALIAVAGVLIAFGVWAAGTFISQQIGKFLQ